MPYEFEENAAMPEREQGRVHTEMDSAEKAMERLQDLEHQLEMRLDTVLRPEPEVMPMDKSLSEITRAPSSHAERIMQLTSRIQVTANMLNVMLNRLEV